MAAEATDQAFFDMCPPEVLGTTVPSAIAHDIRHCAATIMLLAQVLTSEFDDHAAVGSALDCITDSARTIAALVDGPADATGARVDLVAKYVAAQTELLHDGPVAFVAEPVEVLAPHLDVLRVVANLVDNAREAAGPAGSIAVEVSAEGSRAIVRVGDSGPGFPRLRSDRVGLGLSIVERLVTSHGGRMSFDRSSLGGVLVIVELPQRPCAADAANG